jgi:hypothetical protein
VGPRREAGPVVVRVSGSDSQAGPDVLIDELSRLGGAELGESGDALGLEDLLGFGDDEAVAGTRALVRTLLHAGPETRLSGEASRSFAPVNQPLPDVGHRRPLEEARAQTLEVGLGVQRLRQIDLHCHAIMRESERSGHAVVEVRSDDHFRPSGSGW